MRLGAPQHMTVDQRRTVGEAALRARGVDDVPTEQLLLLTRQPVDRVALRHRRARPGAQVAAQLLRQGERQPLLGVADLLDVAVAVRGEPLEDFPDEDLGDRRPRRQADGCHAVEPRLVDRSGVLDQVRRAGSCGAATSTMRTELDEFADPTTRNSSTDGAISLHRGLPVLRRVADVVRRR